MSALFEKKNIVICSSINRIPVASKKKNKQQNKGTKNIMEQKKIHYFASKMISLLVITIFASEMEKNW